MMRKKKIVFLSTLALVESKGWWICNYQDMSKRRIRREYGRMKAIRKSQDLAMRYRYA